MAEREKVIEELEDSRRLLAPQINAKYHRSRLELMIKGIEDVLDLLKEQEEQKRKWLQNIADNQLSIGGVDPLTEYEQGKWDGLQMAFEILTEERQH